MSLGPVTNDPSRAQALAQAQRTQTEQRVDKTTTAADPAADPGAEPTPQKNPVEAAVQEAVRHVQQGIEALLKRAVPPAPGDLGGSEDPALGPQAGRKIRCGRGGRCVADAGPRLGLQNDDVA
jgi:hypothetical protein